MNKAVFFKTTFIFITFTLAVASISAQEFTFTTSAANITASMARIDMPGLANNPNAIIVATPLYDPIKTTQHSLGVWYYNDKWYFFNTDHSTMLEGLKFKLQVFLSPGANEFLQIINPTNLAGGFSVIDNNQINNNPNAVVKILQNHAPDIRTPYKLNPDEAQAIFDAPTGKWYIQNVNGNPLSTYTAYNVVISSGANTNFKVIPKNPTAILPAPTTNTGNAGGDLSGNYPNPTVQKLTGRPLSNIAPQIGDILKWTGTEWAPANTGNGITDAARYNAGAGLSLNGTTFSAQNTGPMWNANQIAGRNIATTAPTTGQVLKWNGTGWAPADDNVTPANAVSPATVNKPTFLYFTQTVGAEAIVDSHKLTTPISGLDNKFFTLSQNSRILIHISAVMTSTNSNLLGGGSSVGIVRVDILSNTSNTVVAWAGTRANLFPNVLEDVNAVGFGVLPPGTYYTRVTIGRDIATDPGLRSGMSDRLIIEIFPD